MMRPICFMVLLVQWKPVLLRFNCLFQPIDTSRQDDSSSSISHNINRWVVIATCSIMTLTLHVMTSIACFCITSCLPCIFSRIVNTSYVED